MSPRNQDSDPALTGGADDAATATVVSGRDGSTEDAELLGMLTDTVPLVVTLGSGTVADAARAVAEQTAAAIDEPPVGLADLAARLGRAVDLDSLLVIESYPGGATTDLARRAGLDVEAIEGADATHYPVSLTVELGSQVQLRVEHDSTRGADQDLGRALLAGVTDVVAALAGEPQGDPAAPAAGLRALAARRVPLLVPVERPAEAPADAADLAAVVAAYAQVFGDELDPDDPGAPDQNFFTLGGDSILAMTLVGECRARGLLVRPLDVMSAPTARALAARARPLAAEPAAPPTPQAAPLVSLDATGSAALDDLLRSLQ